MKKITLILATIALFISVKTNIAVADQSPKFELPDRISGVFYLNELVLNGSEHLLFKTGKNYDESKDPLMRRGTENTDEPQGMFFVIPALFTAVFLVALFVRKK
jgi:hypothetical protein